MDRPERIIVGTLYEKDAGRIVGHFNSTGPHGALTAEEWKDVVRACREGVPLLRTSDWPAVDSLECDDPEC